MKHWPTANGSQIKEEAVSLVPVRGPVTASSLIWDQRLSVW